MSKSAKNEWAKIRALGNHVVVMEINRGEGEHYRFLLWEEDIPLLKKAIKEWNKGENK